MHTCINACIEKHIQACIHTYAYMQRGTRGSRGWRGLRGWLPPPPPSKQYLGSL